MSYLIILLPTFIFLSSLLPLSIYSKKARENALIGMSVIHCCAVLSLCLFSKNASFFNGWMAIDPLAKVFLLAISMLFLCCNFYAPSFLADTSDKQHRLFSFCVPLLLFLMSLMTMSHHFGLLWVLIEAITFVSAPLIYFHRTALALEATWKYLLLCSVGIALALFGSFFLAYSSLHFSEEVNSYTSTLFFDELLAMAPTLSKPWLHAAFVMFLVGYGTKMGIAPLHTWKPDTYGEAPAVIGALLAGGVTACAFLPLLRCYMIMDAASEVILAQQLFLGLGVFSMVFAAVFFVRQRDYKRMLAYSSVENMGILLVGIGIGGNAIFGSLLHLFNNAFTKGALFLSASNIYRAYGSKSTDDVSGAISRVPLSASLLLIGFIAATGSPPFGTFVSKFTIFQEMLRQEHTTLGIVFLATLIFIFIGMGTTIFKIFFGAPNEIANLSPYKDSFISTGPIFILLFFVLSLGIYLPESLLMLLKNATLYLQGESHG